MPVSARLDSNVLVPIVACGFLLTAADLQLYEPIVSATVLEEVRRGLLEDFLSSIQPPRSDASTTRGPHSPIRSSTLSRANTDLSR